MRLTSLARGGGCGCKLGRSALLEALALVPEAPDLHAMGASPVLGLAVAAWRPRSRRCSGPTASPPRRSEMAAGGGVGGRMSAGSLPLLLAVGPERRDGLRRDLAGRGVPHREIGRLTDGPAGRIVVTA